MHQTEQIPHCRLGRSGLSVSRLVLGTMTFGGRTEYEEAERIMSDASEIGVNFLDTADSYNNGASEQIVGRLLAQKRFDWVLATKLGNPMGPGFLCRGLSRRWIIEETERSLKRLGVETIDILYLHKEDNHTPLEETVRAIADLVRAGKIRYFGVSNHRAWRMVRICALCDEIGIDRPVVCQIYYHALNRTAEIELLPACHHLGIGVVAYSPLARGVLTGKYSQGQDAPAGSRAATGDKRIAETEYHPANLKAAASLKDYCNSAGHELAAFAGAWVLANPLVHGIVAGPRTFEQWRGYATAFSTRISESDEHAVDEIVPAGTCAIPNFVDPAYPPEGRPRR